MRKVHVVEDDPLSMELVLEILNAKGWDNFFIMLCNLSQSFY